MIYALLERVEELERRLGLNSTTSGKPPSSDGLKRARRVQSLRKPSGKKAGGQEGLKGELTLQQSSVASRRLSVPDTQSPTSNPQAEACFRKAIDIARKQQAKALELRAAVSLARLWQQQGKQSKARRMLAKIYGWFTKGFETADLKEAKALLDDLS